MEIFRLFGSIFIDTKEAENSLHKTESTFEKLGNKVSSIGEKVGNTGKELTTKVTAPIAGLGTAAVMVGMNFEESLSKVAALTGATGDEFDQLREQAKELGATTRFSASEAADGMAFLGMAGYNTNQILSSMPGLLDLAAAGALELGRAADITTNIMSSFGIEAEKTGHVADVLAKASANANTNIEQMGEAIKYLGPVANSLGWELEESAAAVMSLSNAGIQGSMAGQAFASSLSRLSNPTKAMRGVMDELNLSFFDAQGNMKSLPVLIGELEQGMEGLTAEQKSAALSTLFGAEAYKHWAVLLAEGSETLAQNTKMLVDADGAAQEMAKTMSDNTRGAIREFTSALEGLAIQVSEVILPVITDGAKAFTELVRMLSNVPEPILKMGVAFAALIAAIGPVLMILGSLISSVGTIITTFGTVAGVVSKAGGAFALLSNPIGIAIAAIAGVITILVALYAKFEWFRDMVHAIWENIKEYTSVALEAIKELITSLLSSAIEFAQELLQRFQEFWQEHGETIMAIVQMYFENIKTTIETVMGIIKGIFEIVWPIVSNIVKVTWETMRLTVGSALDIILGLISTTMKILQGDWEGAWEQIKKTAENIMNNIMTFFENIDLLQVGKDIILGLINGITSMGDAVLKAISGVVENGINAAKKLLGIASPSKVFDQMGVDTMEGWNIGVERKKDDVEETAEDLAKTVINPFTGISDAIKDIAFKPLEIVKNTVNTPAPVASAGVGDINITIENMTVRDENDIRLIAREIYNMIQDKLRGGGR